MADDTALAHADILAKVEAADGYASLRNMLRAIAQERGEWAGIPMPIEGQRLIVEPRFPNAKRIRLADEIVNPLQPEPPELGAKIRNVFWSWHRRHNIVVWEQDGRIEWGPCGLPHHVDQLIDTLRASDAWGIEQEATAIQLLTRLLPHRMFKAYMLTGMFLETSPRSGITYVFRRLRPTIALTLREDKARMLAALCLHPIAYYEGSWAGAMCPTDDVIAHLMLMRGDEHLFWKRANQHAVYKPEAGI